MRLLKFILYSFLTIIYGWILGIFLVFHGPFHYLESFAIEDITSAYHSNLLGPLTLWTVTNKGTPSMMVDVTDDSQNNNIISKNIKNNSTSNSDSSIQVLDYKTSTYSAKIMMIPNPKSIKVAVTKYKGDVGETVSEMVADNHAIAGINGGAFTDTSYRGTGGSPLGVTIHDGQLITNSGTQPVIGFTKDGLLVIGNYNGDELIQKGVTEALTFGPVLVKNGKGVVQGDGGWGNAPRTAIGQKEDGTVIMIVTDGRFIHGSNNLGASMKDMMNLMLKYGAVNAANLDGGSSTTMVKDGKLVNQPTDVLGERKVATSFIVLPN